MHYRVVETREALEDVSKLAKYMIDTYNLFFVVDDEIGQIVILRLLKNLQDWRRILRVGNEYHFEL